MESIRQTKSCFEFTYEGRNELDASTLIAGLQSLDTLVLSTKDTCLNHADCNLKIVAQKQGSFIVELLILCQPVISLFMPANIDYASKCADLIVDFLNIKKHIRNSSPKKVECGPDCVEVVNSKGISKTFLPEASGFFKDARIENSIIQIIQSAEKAPGVSGISMKTSRGSNANIDRTEFGEVNKSVVDNMKYKELPLHSTEIIFIKQPVCIGDSKWEFQRDHPFSAKILDEEWMKAYRQGMHPIVPGMQLQVELTSIAKLSPDGMPIEGKTTYEITKVLNTIYPNSDEQSKIY